MINVKTSSAVYAFTESLPFGCKADNDGRKTKPLYVRSCIYKDFIKAAVV